MVPLESCASAPSTTEVPAGTSSAELLTSARCGGLHAARNTMRAPPSQLYLLVMSPPDPSDEPAHLCRDRFRSQAAAMRLTRGIRPTAKRSHPEAPGRSSAR